MLGQVDLFKPIFEAHGLQLICPDFVQTLSEDELCELLPNMDGWIIGDDPASYKVLEAGKQGQLKAVVKWGVGVDNVDFDACKQLGLPVSNTPRMFGEEVADVALGYIIGLARQTFLIDRGVRAGNWPKPAGMSLPGKKLGLIGFGDIGQAIAKRCKAFGLDLTIWDPYASPTSEDHSQYSFKSYPEDIEELDFLVASCALTSETKHMVNEAIFNRAKDGLRVVNVSRGGIVDEKALIDALNSGKVHSAGLDVFEDEPLPANAPIRAFERCILGTHNGSNTVDAVIRASHQAIRLLFGFLEIEIKEEAFL
jgi:D-3-phosphoglycerate dehydrogenase